MLAGMGLSVKIVKDMVTLRHKRLSKTLLTSTTKKEARIKAGYKESYALTGQVDKTKGLKESNRPALERYQKELQAILDAMELKDKNSEEYKTLVDAADKIQKQIQLLSGGETERMGIVELSEVIAKKNAVDTKTK